MKITRTEKSILIEVEPDDQLDVNGFLDYIEFLAKGAGHKRVPQIEVFRSDPAPPDVLGSHLDPLIRRPRGA